VSLSRGLIGAYIVILLGVSVVVSVLLMIIVSIGEISGDNEMDFVSFC
jgi:hypothetical protein